jgi:hypothetical protein
MKIEFTGERGTDWDGLTAKVGSVPDGNHYYVKFFDNGAQITELSRMFSNIDPAINAALGFTTGQELGDRA